MLGQALKLIRKHHDISIAKLSTDIDISRPHLSNIENEHLNVTFKMVERYAKRFNVKPSRIIQFSEFLESESYNGELTARIRQNLYKTFAEEIEEK